MDFQNEAKLKVHEWLSILILIGAIISLMLIALLTESHTKIIDLKFVKSEQKIEVLVKGAVKHSGIYKIPSGMLMRDFLQLADVSPDADLRRLSLDRPLKRARLLNIRIRDKIKVYVRGAVKNAGAFLLPKGSMMSDLLGIVELETGANARFLNKKRHLKSEEVLDVPFENTLKRKKSILKKEKLENDSLL
jgi:SLBB domain